MDFKFENEKNRLHDLKMEKSFNYNFICARKVNKWSDKCTLFLRAKGWMRLFFSYLEISNSNSDNKTKLIGNAFYPNGVVCTNSDIIKFQRGHCKIQKKKYFF